VREIVLTTKPLRPRDKFSYWHDVATKLFFEHDIPTADRRLFEVEVKTTPLGSVKFSICNQNSFTVWRDERQAARAPCDAVFACVQMSGTTIISQDGKDVLIENGGLTLVDTQRPYEFRFSNASQHLVAQISRQEIEARIGDISQLMAYRVDTGNAAGGLTSDFLRSLAARAGGISESQHAQLAGQAVDLLGLALAAGSSRTARLSSARMISLLRLKSAIEARLSDSELTCEEVARVAGISVRYANQLLATEATSLERYILDRRLEKCRQALCDPRQDGRTITEIAGSWGFSDISHFCRIFKVRHEVTAGDYRARSHVTRQSGPE
jgi:AraC family transcriptional activator of tynA and feaB